MRHKATAELFAMKAIKLEDVVEYELDIMLERAALLHSECAFVVKLKASFCEGTKAYLVMEFCPGGELFVHLSNHKRFSEAKACFFIAELVLALEHIHSLGYIYRDLKPENVMLDVRTTVWWF